MTSRRGRLLGVGLSVAVALVGGDARAASTLGVETAEPGLAASAASIEGVEIVVDPEVLDAEMTRVWIEERATKVIGELEHPLEEEDLIRVVVRGAPFDYRISLELRRHGRALAAEHQPAEIMCDCGSDEMLDRIGEGIEAGARTLAEVAGQERAAAAAAAAREEAERRRQEAEREALVQASYRPTTLGRAGIGVLGSGVVVMTSGVVMAVQPRREVSEQQIVRREWSSSGYAVIGIGTAAVVGGLTVLIVDIVRCRREPSRCAPPPGARTIEGMRWASRARAAGGAR